MKTILLSFLLLAVCLFPAVVRGAEEESPWPAYARDSIFRLTGTPTLTVGKAEVSIRVADRSWPWKRNPETTLDPRYRRNDPELKFYGDEFDLDTEASYTFEFVDVGACDNFFVQQEYWGDCFVMACSYLLRILQGDQVLFAPETKFAPRIREPLPEACDAAPDTPLVEEMKRLLYVRTLCEVQDEWDRLADYEQPIEEAKTFCADTSAFPKAVQELTAADESQQTILLVMQPFWSFFVLVLLYEPEAGDVETLMVDMYTGVCGNDFDLTPRATEVERVSPDLPLFVGQFEVEGHGTAVTAIYTRSASGEDKGKRFRANRVSLAFH